VSPDPALARLESWPRTRLVHEPTPLLEARNLSADLGRADEPILLKMDGETGFGLGGNKLRKLEFELAPDRIEHITHVVTCGGIHSNHCRLTAAAAARLGLKCILVLSGEVPEEPTGNALLHQLFGAELRPVPGREARPWGMDRAREEVEAGGGRALVIPLGASTPLGCLGYARAACELHGELPAQDRRTWIFVSASSCGTWAGLALGFALLGRQDIRVVGVSPDDPLEEIGPRALNLVRGGAGLLDYDGPLPPEPLDLTDAHIGDGYGIPTPASEEASRIFAKREGVILDDFYTGKVAAAMIETIRSGEIPEQDRIVFWHTGGYPSVFR
jgi:1-aminocyclopropane-1-carboxylate deaminase/D-cysteine desulfhydrase-like pyridoxal-dependent ACC family enzyme